MKLTREQKAILELGGRIPQSPGESEGFLHSGAISHYADEQAGLRGTIDLYQLAWLGDGAAERNLRILADAEGCAGNAILIAAAPDLLAACEYLATIIDRSAPQLAGMMEYKAARAAIAKATGSAS